MADRYPDRHFPADDGYDHGENPRPQARGESDPLAELARLIGQTDPFGANARTNANAPARAGAHDDYDDHEDAGHDAPPSPPPWLQRGVRQEAPSQHYAEQNSYDDDADQDLPSTEHPLRRYAAQQAQPQYTQPQYTQPQHGHSQVAQPENYQDSAPQFAHDESQLDPSRYDDALYGEPDPGVPLTPYGQAYGDEPYAYPQGYDETPAQPAPRRSGGVATVAVVLALAVLGTGAAFAYRTYVGSPRSGEPPIIKADTTPTKIVPAPADGNGKVPDRLATGDGSEKIVPREEAPVDVKASAGPRMVFPPLNQNANPPSVANVSPNTPPPTTGGTMPNNEPRKIKTFSVKGDQPDTAAVPVNAVAAPKPAKPVTAQQRAPVATSPSNANASANAPLSLSPQAAAQPTAPEPKTRVANNAPVQIAPASDGSGYLVQVSSQKTEGEAQSAYRVLQGKYGSVLGSQSMLVKRVDLSDKGKGIVYRAFAGPFSSLDQATQVRDNLKAAGGPSGLIQRN